MEHVVDIAPITASINSKQPTSDGGSSGRKQKRRRRRIREDHSVLMVLDWPCETFVSVHSCVSAGIRQAPGQQSFLHYRVE
jgi:hypothetical protein